MPKATVKRNAGATGGGAKKAASGAKKSKIYNMPEKIKEGTILRDLMQTEWKIGPSIGTGGFGEIYSACKNGDNKYDYVVKCVSLAKYNNKKYVAGRALLVCPCRL